MRRRTWGGFIVVLAVAALPAGRGVGDLVGRDERPPDPPSDEALVLPKGADVQLHQRPSRQAPADEADGTTPFGQRVLLPVLDREGRWVQVLGNGAGSKAKRWVVPPEKAKVTERPRTVLIDLSDRRMQVLDEQQVVESWPIKAGRRDAPTPPGTYAITDELPGARFSPVYGCCILALSGRQKKLPAGWRGGNRLAIHGTASGETEPSIGCITLKEEHMRRLVELVGRGSVVTIRR